MEMNSQIFISWLNNCTNCQAYDVLVSVCLRHVSIERSFVLVCCAKLEKEI
jgi:hypothetical protein